MPRWDRIGMIAAAVFVAGYIGYLWHIGIIIR